MPVPEVLSPGKEDDEDHDERNNSGAARLSTANLHMSWSHHAPFWILFISYPLTLATLLQSQEVYTKVYIIPIYQWAHLGIDRFGNLPVATVFKEQS